MKELSRLLLLTLVFVATSGHAKPFSPEQLPESLKPWVNWVLHDVQDYDCPFLYNNYQNKRCSWPSRLALDLRPNQGRFTTHWKVFSDSWIELPGNVKHWPQNVQINHKPALVMQRNGKPSIFLTAGNYQISGDFLWDFIPENLAIPEETGLIKLSINQKIVHFPAIKQGRLWLRAGNVGQKKSASDENKLVLQVFRKVVDDVPLQLITRLDLNVSGKQREIKLPNSLLQDFIPMRLNSPLPARIDPDGSLILQIKPGHWQIELHARNMHELELLSLNENQSIWPKQEIWVFAARPYQRVVEIEGIAAIDPSQTNLPESWKKLPAYQIKQGTAMRFKTLRRGDPEPEPDQLRLTRKIWLDFNGAGYTIQDHISGTMTRSRRLNALPETQLGRVLLDGQSQLITHLPDQQQRGIEVRKGKIQVQAESRKTGAINSLNAVGWEHNFNHVSAELNLPPGWRLFSASGIDNVPDSWISRWTLLDLFLVLISALAISRLWNLYWGVLAILTLAMIWHEPDAPRLVWLNILAATALIKVLPEGRFLSVIKAYRKLTWLALLIIAIPFMVSQVRIALYPQLEKPWQAIQNYRDANLVAPAVQSASVEAEAMAVRKSVSKLRNLSETVLSQADSGIHKKQKFDRIDPNANVQTGPGLPQWQWQKIHLSWNGSVDMQQQIQFSYLPPAVSIMVNLSRVILLALLAMLMFGLVNKFNKIKVTPGCLIYLLLLPVTFFPVQDVNAEYPDAKLLEELQQRLLQAPECLPGCAQINRMELDIDSDTLSSTLQIDARQSVAIPLPVQAKHWLPDTVLVNGQTAQAIFRRNNTQLWINLDRGHHTVSIKGKVPLLDNFIIPLSLKPHHVVVRNQGWEVSGLHEHGIVEKQLQFTKITKKQAPGKPSNFTGSEILPPFVRVERTLQLGLDWRVKTRLIRVSPLGSAIVLNIPLLRGESITSPGMRSNLGVVQANMSANQSILQWESVLVKTDQIQLTAAKTDQWTEVWIADISPIWHLQTTGIAAVHHQDRQGRWLPEWRPWQGETVSLHITRPEAVSGRTLTIDYSRLQIKPGKRMQEASLEFNLRSSQGTQHIIELPEKALLQSVSVNGQKQAIRQQHAKISLPVKPGQQDYKINWIENTAMSSLLTTPSINLGQDSVNSTINMILGEDRWVLFVWGPQFGPAVLFWGVLLVIICLSFALGKVALTPLKHWHWLLLFIGLSQIPIASALVVVAWLFALALREHKQPDAIRYFNVMQIGLALLTIVALLLLFYAVQQGLLGSPEMQITGNQSTAFKLNWFQDLSHAELPTATVVSVPLIAYRLIMLAWSLWLAVALLNWLQWGWQCYSSNGLWKKTQTKSADPLVTEKKNNAVPDVHK